MWFVARSAMDLEREKFKRFCEIYLSASTVIYSGALLVFLLAFLSRLNRQVR